MLKRFAQQNGVSVIAREEYQIAVSIQRFVRDVFEIGLCAHREGYALDDGCLWIRGLHIALRKLSAIDALGPFFGSATMTMRLACS